MASKVRHFELSRSPRLIVCQLLLDTHEGDLTASQTFRPRRECTLQAGSSSWSVLQSCSMNCLVTPYGPRTCVTTLDPLTGVEGDYRACGRGTVLPPCTSAVSFSSGGFLELEDRVPTCFREQGCCGLQHTATNPCDDSVSYTAHAVHTELAYLCRVDDPVVAQQRYELLASYGTELEVAVQASYQVAVAHSYTMLALSCRRRLQRQSQMVSSYHL